MSWTFPGVSALLSVQRPGGKFSYRDRDQAKFNSVLEAIGRVMVTEMRKAAMTKENAGTGSF